MWIWTGLKLLGDHRVQRKTVGNSACNFLWGCLWKTHTWSFRAGIKSQRTPHKRENYPRTPWETNPVQIGLYSNLGSYPSQAWSLCSYEVNKRRRRFGLAGAIHLIQHPGSTCLWRDSWSGRQCCRNPPGWGRLRRSLPEEPASRTSSCCWPQCCRSWNSGSPSAGSCSDWTAGTEPARQENEHRRYSTKPSILPILYITNNTTDKGRLINKGQMLQCFVELVDEAKLLSMSSASKR